MASNLPPGCTNAMIENMYGAEQPCDICGRWADNCICPTCKVCDMAGNPYCYDGGLECSSCGKGTYADINKRHNMCMCRGGFIVVIHPHGMVRSAFQIASKAQADEAIRIESEELDQLQYEADQAFTEMTDDSDDDE